MKQLPLIPTLAIAIVLVLGLPTLDYHLDGKQGWLTVVGALPGAGLVLWMVVAGLLGWRRDLKKK